MKITRPARRRRGITLVELMAAMTTLTIILAVCAALMTMLMRLDGSGRDHVANEATLARLARAFRADVREADRVEPLAAGKPSNGLSLADGASHSVEYAIVKGAVVRREWWDDVVVAQERFTLPASASPRFERLPGDGPAILALVLDRRSAKAVGEAATHPYRIEAASGAARRFSAKEGPSR